MNSWTLLSTRRAKLPLPPPEELLFTRSRKGRRGFSLPEVRVPEDLPASQLREELPLPELTEGEVVRHFLRLSQRNWSVDTGFYPLGSCTMKYNPKLHEQVANWEAFREVHPYQPEETWQGFLAILWELEQFLCEIFGADAFTLAPAAGAHGELTGLLLMRRYHEKKGNHEKREIILPDSAHGTNPASVTMAGFVPVEIHSTPEGTIALEEFRKVLSPRTAGFMITNPNTLGKFEPEIQEILEALHEVDALAYYDGANMNALLGYARPGDMGFDIIHVNIHKTFSTPHGSGGPGAGPVGVKRHLEPFLPVPRIRRTEEGYRLDYDLPDTIGKIKTFWGHLTVLVRAYLYIRELGPEGLRRVAELAVLNANYLMKKLEPHLPVASPGPCGHEFVLSAAKLHQETGVRAVDIAKRLMDYGFHPPTVYFPLIVPEALMIEPTETESKETLDAFASAIEKIVEEARTDPELVRTAPHTMPVRRPDEVRAARQPDLAHLP